MIDLLGEVGIELFVPQTVERCGHVQPFAVQAELHHLWPSRHLLSVHTERLRLALQQDGFYTVRIRNGSAGSTTGQGFYTVRIQNGSGWLYNGTGFTQ